jgi:glycerol-3-phosphate dehydrogenase
VTDNPGKTPGDAESTARPPAALSRQLSAISRQYWTFIRSKVPRQDRVKKSRVLRLGFTEERFTCALRVSALFLLDCNFRLHSIELVYTSKHYAFNAGITEMSSRIRRETEKTEFDVAVIGGGIIGAGIARDAAMRNLKVALFERNDFSCGATSGSTRLVHGGLRYLEMLDLRLVRMDLRERETLLRIAPHLVKPLQFLMPFYSRSLLFRLKMRLGMVLYDVLSFDKSLPSRRYLSADELMTVEPHLRADKLQGASGFFDAQVNSPERLCLENILSAREHGAVAFNYAEVTAGLPSGRGIAGVRVRDLFQDGEVEVRSRIVVNAAGPWVDRVAAKLTTNWQRQIRTTKGIHIACAPVCRHAMALFSPIDRRLFFVIPWLGYTWLGTTDTDFVEDPASARADGSDVQYLLDSASSYFPEIGASPILFSNAGVRALVKDKGDESSISRMHRLMDGERAGTPGLITVLGGKITGYRAIAEEVTNLICRKLKNRRPCLTAITPLPGAQKAALIPESSAVDQETLDHLKTLYGSRASQVLELASSDEHLKEPLDPGYRDIAAQVVFAVRSEQCVRVLDFIERRTLLGFTPDQGRRALPGVVSLMSCELGWSSSRVTQEIESYEQRRQQTQKFIEELKRPAQLWDQSQSLRV